MSDWRRIEVEKTLTATYVVDVERWFTDWADEWGEYDADDYDNPVDAREDFIRDTAWELAAGGDLDPSTLTKFDDEAALDVSIDRCSPPVAAAVVSTEPTP